MIASQNNVSNMYKPLRLHPSQHVLYKSLKPNQTNYGHTLFFLSLAWTRNSSGILGDAGIIIIPQRSFPSVVGKFCTFYSFLYTKYFDNNLVYILTIIWFEFRQQSGV